MADARHPICAFDAGGPAEEVDVAVVVARGHQLVAQVLHGVKSVVAGVDVGAVLALCPDALHAPAEDTALRCPLGITVRGGTTGLLRAVWNAVE